MWRNVYKIFTVLIAIISVATAGIAISTKMVGPDVRSEMDTLAMEHYTFSQTSDVPPKWTVTRRFSIDPANPAERGSVGTHATPYDAILKAHQDLATQLGAQTSARNTQMTELKTLATQFKATQEQDDLAVKARIQELTARSDELAREVLKKSTELQTLSENAREIRETTAQRRTDVLRLRHELDELRTDLFRLTAIRRDLTDRLVRLEIENQELAARQVQLDQTAGERPPGSAAQYDGAPTDRP